MQSKLRFGVAAAALLAFAPAWGSEAHAHEADAREVDGYGSVQGAEGHASHGERMRVEEAGEDRAGGAGDAQSHDASRERTVEVEAPTAEQQNATPFP